MVILPDGTLRYSPTDLIAFLEGDFAAWMERAQLERSNGRMAIPAAGDLTPDPDDPELALLQRAGLAHEHRFVERLQSEGRQVTKIAVGDDSVARTLAAMHAGHDIIYQAHLQDGAFHGFPDFLFRRQAPSALGAYLYEPWDTKLARSAKPYFVVQLCGYAVLLSAVQRVLPEQLMVRLGDHSERRFGTHRYIRYFRHLARAFEDFQATFDPDHLPDPGLERSWGRWTRTAEALLVQRDHLRLVAGMTRSRIARLEAAGITTMAALARLRASDVVPRIGTEVLARLSAQARLQVESRGLASPLWEVTQPTADEPSRGLGGLPPAHPSDVYFDMEGFPFAEEGLEYLFGAVTVNSAVPEFHDWWGHDRQGEKRALEDFVDWVWERWRAHPGMHIYHYASYEVSAVRRLMGRHATREERVDDLLRHEVFVDLYTLVRQGVRIGTPSYSLKDVERLYRPARGGTVTTAGGSVVEYQRWLDSGEPREWQRSPILQGIRTYNRDDCVSTWELAEWLRARQAEQGIRFAAPAPSAEPTADLREPGPADVLAAELLARAARAADPEEARVLGLVAWLLGYHKREEKPMWWRLFDRRDASEDELFDDADCLAGVVLTDTPPVTIKRSRGFEYQFDPNQDTKVRSGDTVCFSHDIDRRLTVVSLDEDAGRLVLKFGPKLSPPDRGHLLPFEHVSSRPIQEAVQRFAGRLLAGDLSAGRAVEDLLCRRAPRVTGRDAGPLIDPAADLLPALTDLLRRLDGTTICLQGPPGTGKTWTSARVIAALCREGARIGVASNSHKAIFNLLRAVAEVEGPAIRLVKVGTEPEDDPLIVGGRVAVCESDEAGPGVAAGPLVIGATAWTFCRAELEGTLDYLFVDEAGQVALANLVGMGLSARNLVLVGDQMQLAQPTQGTHPGESGSSCLEYALHGHATVPPEMGIFLGVTRRMHPDVNRFISDAVYEGRLTSHDVTTQRRVDLPRAGPLARGTGIVVLEVAHEGNTQECGEEADAIRAVVEQLAGGEVSEGAKKRQLDPARDILVVAPYNMQVRRLRGMLPGGMQVGSVDKFQGLEAPVVIVSMCASALEDAARGAEFLLSPNRLNVAISRAQCLAVVLVSPGLFRVRCTSIKEMELLNLLCWLREYAHHTA